MNEFAHDRKTQFMNVALNFNLVPLRTVPYSPLGAGVIVIPHKDVLLSVMALCGLITLWLAGRFFDRRTPADYGFHLNRRWWLDFGFGCFLGALLMTFIFLVELALGWITIQRTFSSPLLPFWASMGIGIMSYIGVGLNEEILARGYGLRNLAEGLRLAKVAPRTAFLASYLITSILFGAFHLMNANATWVSTFFIMIIGLLLGLGYILTGELAIPIGIHITWNFFQGYVFGFPVSGGLAGNSLFAIQQAGPALWTGGAFGPEAGFIGILATALGCILVVLWVRWRYGKLQLQSRLAAYLPAQSSLPLREDQFSTAAEI
jgi:membrane protease YdiL (CAAX protease family)